MIRRVFTLSKLRKISDAFIYRNKQKVTEFVVCDNEVNTLYANTLQDYMKVTASKPEATSQITHLTFICMYLDCCADHTTNLDEHLIYLIKGAHLKPKLIRKDNNQS